MFLSSFLTCRLQSLILFLFFFVSVPDYTWQYSLKYTLMKLRTLQVEELFLSLENIIRVAVSSVMGDGYVIADESKKIMYIMRINCMVEL